MKNKNDFLFNHLRKGLIAALLLIPVFGATAGADPVKALFPQWLVTTIQGENVRIPYDSNHPISTHGDEITRLVVLIHGAGRSKVTFDRVEAAAREQGLNESTFIFQPQFLIDDDIEAFQLPDDVLYWSGGWRQGNLSHRSTAELPRKVRISSFAITDYVIGVLVVNNPNIRSVVIAGHSAGGQFAQRFAAGSQLEDLLSDRGISVRYVTANPSSYVYLNKQRPVIGGEQRFATPSKRVRRRCDDFNEYKYGLNDINQYMASAGPEKIREQYPLREVFYILGADDNDTSHRSLSKDCEANLQGADRLERGINFYHYLSGLFGPEVHKRHRQIILPGFGHTSRVFTTDCGISVLLDAGSCALITPTHLKAETSSNVVNLDWIDQAEGESGYAVERASGDDGEYQQIATIAANATTYSDQSASKGQYRYRVSALDGERRSGYSNSVGVKLR